MAVATGDALFREEKAKRELNGYQLSSVGEGGFKKTAGKLEETTSMVKGCKIVEAAGGEG